jgi:hypothetical protein
MNEVVDLDQTRLLCLIIMLVADLCYHYKDYNRSFFFYSQAVHLSKYRNYFLLILKCIKLKHKHLLI